MQTLLQDLRYGLRMLARNPGFTAVAVLTLALGIGANTAMFSVVNAVLLRPLAYKDPDRLVSIQVEIPSMNITGGFVEYNTFADYWRAQSRSFQSVMAFTPVWVNLTSGGTPERVFAFRVNAGFLTFVGTKPELGREFLSSEDLPNAPRVAMVSHRLWVRRFGGDPALVGRAIVFDRNTYTAVGILPANFDFYAREADLYMPIAASTARVPGQPTVGVHARLKPGASVKEAQAEIDGLCRRWVAATHYPKDWGARVWPLRDYSVREVRASVVILAVAVGLVLLIACANVASLLLARGASRQREIAIRSTLGASPSRIVRQLLSESVLLGLMAGALGLLAAWGGVRALAATPAYLPFQDTLAMDLPVLWFTLGATVLTILLFGLAPGLAAAHVRLAENLQEGGRAGEGMRRSRLRESLVFAEVALALLLAIGATLSARSLIRLEAVDPGFNADGVLTANLTLPEESYARPEQRVNFFQALLERLRTMPNVKAASMVSHLPFGYSKSGRDVTIEGAPPRRPGESLIVFGRSIDPDYFQTLKVRLLRGRFFDTHDPAGPLVAVINETMARRCWPNQDPVGKRFAEGRGDRWVTVVGVAADMRQTSLAEEPDMESFVPYRQSAEPSMSLVVRTSMDPLRMAPALRTATAELDRELPVSEIGTIVGSIAHSTRERRLTVALFGAFALLAVLLAAVGIYGVVSYSVERRTHEIGVRMALGALRGRILVMVVGRALLLGGVGVAIGIVGALALTRLLRSILYGVSATDPVVFVGVSLFLLAVAALAGFVPARRATKVDPMVALRYE
jgi:putative ABC transport system permease protein